MRHEWVEDDKKYFVDDSYGGRCVAPTHRGNAIRAMVREILRLAEENRWLKEGARLVLAGFDDGVFIRDINGDGSREWLLKLIEPLRGLGLLSEHGRKEE